MTILERSRAIPIVPALLCALLVVLATPALGSVRPTFEGGDSSQPSISRQHPVSHPAFGENAQVSTPAVARDGRNYLVVWEERRSNPAVFAARLSPDGELLDPAGVFIARRTTHTRRSLPPAVSSLWSGRIGSAC